MKYEAAIKELETIAQKMENDEYDIDQLSEQLKRANELITLCRNKLTKSEAEIRQLAGDEQ